MLEILAGILGIGLPILAIACDMAIWYIPKGFFARKSAEIPDEISCLEAGRLGKGMTFGSDAGALLVKLANDGYIRFVNDEYARLAIAKIKEYEGDNEDEATIMHDLFVNASSITCEDDSIVGYTTATNEDLSKTYGKCTDFMAVKINYRDIPLGIDSKLRLRPGRAVLLITLILVLAMGVIPFLVTGKLVSHMLSALFILPFLYIGEVTAVGSLKGSNNVTKIWGMIFGFIFVIVPVQYMVATMEQFISYSEFTGMLVQAALILAVIGSACETSILTKYGKKLQNKSSGFLKFVSRPNNRKMRKMIEKNPQYFYEALPYACSMGYGEQWLRKGKELEQEVPEWYGRGNVEDYDDFCKGMEESLHVLSRM